MHNEIRRKVKRLTNELELGVIVLKIIYNTLTAIEYLEMHKLVNFYPYEYNDVRAALEKDIINIKIYSKDKLVGIGRVVGDGRIVFFLKDIIVHPEFQNKGVGTLLVMNLLNQIKKIGCDHAYIGLMSTSGTENFYERFGFIKRPNGTFGSGMVMFVEK